MLSEGVDRDFTRWFVRCPGRPFGGRSTGRNSTAFDRPLWLLAVACEPDVGGIYGDVVVYRWIDVPYWTL